MVIIFHDFVVDHDLLPDGGLAIKFIEAMEGEGPDGKRGIVGTGNKFSVRMTREVAINYILDGAITIGLMEDQDTPVVADMETMKKELAKRKKDGRRPKR